MIINSVTNETTYIEHEYIPNGTTVTFRVSRDIEVQIEIAIEIPNYRYSNLNIWLSIPQKHLIIYISNSPKIPTFKPGTPRSKSRRFWSLWVGLRPSSRISISLSGKCSFLSFKPPILEFQAILPDFSLSLMRRWVPLSRLWPNR